MVKCNMKSTKKAEVVNWDEVIGKPENSPLYDPEEAAAVAANVREAEKMTWEELKRRAESCPP